MPVKWLLAVLLFAGCMRIQTPTRIALLAPFEGRYREVGYEALYAARLAFQDAQTDAIELLAVDDGGTIDSASDRARALVLDPQVRVVLVLGYAATNSQSLASFADLPVLVVGEWEAQPLGDRVFILTNPAASDHYTLPPRADVLEAAKAAGPITGGDILSLDQFRDLHPQLSDVQIVTTSPLADTSFTERYRSSDQFAPEPRLIAPATYAAMSRAIETLQAAPERSALAEALGNTGDYAAGYLADAPIFTYGYDENGDLVAVDPVVEQR